MARGVTFQPRGLLLPIPSTPSLNLQPRCLSPLLRRAIAGLSSFVLTPRSSSSSSRCCSTLTKEAPAATLEGYREAFARRMEMAGLRPHHHIAIGVSGGPDSMALCALTAGWKLDGNGDDGVGNCGGFIDGLLAIVVDHGLRVESGEEARIVSHRVSEMGIRCEVVNCSWPDGKPEQGHVQEAAREMRYQMFQKVCMKHRIDVLLIGHHADDQVELFVLRLSRNSGVLGLSGMAFASQMFTPSKIYEEGSNEGILVVRPLLHFAKEDMYKICQDMGRDWVEDPTNQSLLYARNRIRSALGDFPSMFRAELQTVISACRKARAYVDLVSGNLLHQALTVMDEGYAIIDLEILNASQVTDICLSKFVSYVLQFISQRNRPVRGHTSKLLLDYFRNSPCKTSFTAAGCYLCPAPGSRGTKVLVCRSVNSSVPPETELFQIHLKGEQQQNLSDLEQIITDGKSYYDHFVPDVSDVPLLNVASESVLTEAKKLNMISESTYHNILQLQREETNYFRAKVGDKVDYKRKNKTLSASAFQSEPIQPGQTCYFMSRFMITWNRSPHVVKLVANGRTECDEDSGTDVSHHEYQSCRIGNDVVVIVRSMTDSDWFYISKLSKDLESIDMHGQGDEGSRKEVQKSAQQETQVEVDDLKLSVQKAKSLLKVVPVAARRSLPVLVSFEGQLLSIPSIGFNYCSCLAVSCRFKPRRPLGGGHNSFL